MKYKNNIFAVFACVIFLALCWGVWFELAHVRETIFVIKNTRTTSTQKVVATLPVTMVTLVDVRDIQGKKHFIKIPANASDIIVKKITPQEIKIIQKNQQAELTPEQKQNLLKSIKIVAKASRPNNFLGALSYNFKFLLADGEDAVDNAVSALAPDAGTQLVDVSSAVTSDQTVDQATETPTPVPAATPAPTPAPEVCALDSDCSSGQTCVNDFCTTPVPTETPAETPSLIETTSPSTENLTQPLPLTSIESPSPEAMAEQSQNQSPCQGDATDNCVAVQYNVPAPVISETNTDTGKLVTVSADDSAAPLVDVLAATTIPKIFKVGEESKIHIKWKNNGNQNVTFSAQDTDGDGYLDYVEWTVPHLSDQTFEIIFISKAFQLDVNQNIIGDIYEQVATQDGNYAQLTDGQYVRATFYQKLDNTKDITIYAKPDDPSSPGKVEVYPVYDDGNGNLTEGPKLDLVDDGQNPNFDNISADGKYRILLKNLQTPTDVFDLKITGNVDIDYIVDPVGWLTGWTDRKKITISNTNVSADLTAFPLLVKITADSDMSTALASGYDIRFTDVGGITTLPYEREYWSGGGGGAVTAIFWVQVPTITTATTTTIYIYYNNSGASDGQAATSVWDANYVGVWHMNQTGTVVSWLDSTSHGNSFTNNNATAGTGNADGGGVFSGTAQYATRSPLIASGDFTLEAWFNPANVSGAKAILTQGRESDGTYIGIKLSGSSYDCYVDGASAITYSAGLTAGNWYFAALAYAAASSPKTTLYHNGVSHATQSNSANYTNQYDYLGAGTTTTSLFNGSIDEVRISNIARPASWAKFEYYNDSSANNELTIAGQETNSPRTLYWVGSGSGAGANISVAGNWCNEAPTATCVCNGGAANVGDATSAPGNIDDAHFVSACVNNATVNTNWAVQNLYLDTGYTGTNLGIITVSNLITAGTVTMAAGTMTFNYNVGTGSTYVLTTTGNFTMTGGNITHTANTTAEKYKVTMNIGGNFDLESPATINTNGDGFPQGYGPGLGITNVGGSYGGLGGFGSGSYGPTYGSVTNPVNIGSGAPAAQGTSAGGGAVILNVAGSFTNNNTISANGSGAYCTGSGGSVNITAQTISNGGTISANGGSNGSNYSDGGGGRVAIIITGSGSTFGTVTAYGGVAGATYGQNGAAGTVYEQASTQTTGTGALIINNNNATGNYGYATTTDVPAGTTWSAFSSISLLGKGLIGIPATSTLNISAITVTGDATNYNSGIVLKGGAFVTPATFSDTNYYLKIQSASSTFTGATSITLGSHATLVDDVPFTISNVAMEIQSGGNMTHTANVAAESYKINLSLTGTSTLTLDSGGTINVNNDGYAQGNVTGYGPAPATRSGTTYGASYGGMGGNSTSTTAVYGSVTNPVNIGSGGAYGGNGGGGAVILNIAGAFTDNGSITANCLGAGAYGGAGGSVNITAASITGNNATITANGGGSGGYLGAGGGGRIAIILTGAAADFSGFTNATVTAYGGVYNSGAAGNGAAGTVYEQTTAQGANGGTLIIDNHSNATSAAVVTDITSNTTNATVGTITLQNKGNFTVESGQTFTTSAAGTTLTINANSTLTNIGTLSLSGTTFTNSGTFTSTASTSTVTYTGNPADSTGVTPINASYYNLTIASTNSSTIYTPGVNVAVGGNLSVSAGTLAIGTNNLTVTGNSTVTGGTATIGISGGTGWTTAGMTVGAGGTVTCSGASKINVGGNWDSSAGTFNYSTSTIYLTGATQTVKPAYGQTIYNLSATTAGQTITMSSAFIINGTLTVGSASGSKVTMTGYFQKVAGTTPIAFNRAYNTGYNIDGMQIVFSEGNAVNFTIPSGTYGGIISSVYQAKITLAGDTTFNGNVSLYSSYANSAILDTGGFAMTINGNLSVGTASGKYGKVIANNSTIVVTGNVASTASLAGGQIDATGTSSWSVAGNWSTTNITFTKGSSTIILNGTSQTLSGATTFYNLTAITPDQVIIFPQTSTTTISGTFKIEGSSGHNILLKSDEAGTDGAKAHRARVDIAAISDNHSHTYPQYVTPYDNDASNGAVNPILQQNCTDGGNNLGWQFNLLPTSSNVVVNGSSAVILSPGTTQNVVCTARVDDLNGYTDIASISAKFFRTGAGAGAANGSDDNNNYRYTLSGTTAGNCGGTCSGNTCTTCTFTFNVSYYADPTDATAPTYSADNWTCEIIPHDGVGPATSPGTATIEVNSLQAINVDSTITFDNNGLGMTPGTKSSGTHKITVTNAGNISTQFEVKGNSLTCTRSSVPVDHQKYSLSGFSYDSGGTTLTGSYALVSGSSTAVLSSKDTYWQIFVPTGAAGTCSGSEEFNSF